MFFHFLSLVRRSKRKKEVEEFAVLAVKYTPHSAVIKSTKKVQVKVKGKDLIIITRGVNF